MTEYKPGDELAVHCRNGWDGEYTILTIEKVTPSGRIVTNGYTLNPDLTIRGSSGHYGPYRAVPMTDAIRESVARHKAIRAVNQCELKDLPTDCLLAIQAIINKHKDAP